MKKNLGKLSLVALSAVFLASCMGGAQPIISSLDSHSSGEQPVSSSSIAEESFSEKSSSPSSEISSSSEESLSSSNREESSEFSSNISSSTESSTSEDEERIEWIGTDAYPYYSTPSTRFAMSIQTGWNLGNTLDAHSDSCNESENYIDLQGTTELGINEMDLETCYGNPKTTSALLKKVKQAGYTTIRIPVSWHQHVTKWNNFQISSQWMSRVKAIVDQSLGYGFKVILNTHHDIDPSFIYPDYAHLDNSLRFVESIWSQISTVFGDYGTDLVYEGCNEPRLTKHADSFNTELNNEEVRNCIHQINQKFVDVIRSSNKANEQKRYLIIKGYADSPYVLTYSHASTFSLPNDPRNRLLISVHIYSPTEFAFHGTGGFDPDNLEYTSHIKWILDGLYQEFVMKGIGVVLGEWGSVATASNLNERVAHANYFVSETKNRHIASIYWDNGAMQNEAFALFDRANETNLYPSINEAINSHWTTPGNNYNVKYFANGTYLTSEDVREGNKALGPSLPWGYGYDNLYSDASCTQPFSLDTPITSNMNIYLGNYGVIPTSTAEADNDWGPIDPNYIYSSEGAWYCTCPGKGKNNNYETQVNFVLPLLEDDRDYRITFSYKVTGSNASYLVYNDATSSSATSTKEMSGDGSWHEGHLYFNSNDVTYKETRFTFNLAGVPSSVQSINFGIKDLSISKNS
ncbi:MAG: glycoside hydrolase family 5 protein [Bacilli bacterium]|nr:glycoside hydrolase family 5 protein [Bacilli bacterium]